MGFSFSIRDSKISFYNLSNHKRELDAPQISHVTFPTIRYDVHFGLWLSVEVRFKNCFFSFRTALLGWTLRDSLTAIAYLALVARAWMYGRVSFSGLLMALARFFILCFFLYVFYEGKLITIQITVNRLENHTGKKTTESRMATCLFHVPSDTFNLKMQPKFLHVNLIFLLAPSIITKWKSCIKFGLPVITTDKFLNLYADKISWYDCLRHNFKGRFTSMRVISKLIKI